MVVDGQVYEPVFAPALISDYFRYTSQVRRPPVILSSLSLSLSLSLTHTYL